MVISLTALNAGVYILILISLASCVSLQVKRSTVPAAGLYGFGKISGSFISKTSGVGEGAHATHVVAVGEGGCGVAVRLEVGVRVGVTVSVFWGVAALVRVTVMLAVFTGVLVDVPCGVSVTVKVIVNVDVLTGV